MASASARPSTSSRSPLLGQARPSFALSPRPPLLSPERAFEINDLAWAHFTRPVAHVYAVEWLQRARGIDVWALERSAGQKLVGHTGIEWSTLTTRPRLGGVREEELLAADLAQRTSRGTLIDSFRGRLIFPLRDSEGRITGFTGRDTTSDPRSPKYRTLASTSIHAPSASLYSPTLVTHGGAAIVVEGPLDALAIASVAATAGRELTAYASGGANPTQAQAERLLAGGHSRIVLALDGDPAGREGTLRWVDHVCRQAGQSAYVADLADGTDPADLMRTTGVAALDLLLDGREPLPELAEINRRAQARPEWTPRQPVAGIAI